MLIDMNKYYDFIRDTIDYLEVHATDMWGLELYNIAISLLADIQVTPIDIENNI